MRVPRLSVTSKSPFVGTRTWTLEYPSALSLEALYVPFATMFLDISVGVLPVGMLLMAVTNPVGYVRLALVPPLLRIAFAIDVSSVSVVK